MMRWIVVSALVVSLAASCSLGGKSGDQAVEPVSCVTRDGSSIVIPNLDDVASPTPGDDILTWFEFDGRTVPVDGGHRLGSLDDWAMTPAGHLIDRFALDEEGSRVMVDAESSAFEVCVGDGVVEAVPTLQCLATSTWNAVTVSWWGPTVEGQIAVYRSGSPIFEFDEIEDAVDSPSAIDLEVERRLIDIGNLQNTWMATLGVENGIFTDFAVSPGEPLVYDLVLNIGTDRVTAACGSAALPGEFPRPACSTVDANGLPAFEAVYDDEVGPPAGGLVRDGQAVDTGPGPAGVGPLVDATGEPGRSYEYELSITAPGYDEPVLIPCGSAQRSAAGSDDGDLSQAGERFMSLESGPYLYIDFTVDGVAYQGSGGPAAPRFVMEPALPVGVDFDLATLHGDLAAAIEQGQDVAYEIDAFSGVPTSFVLDGRQWTISCVEYDTAPPELRSSPCGSDNNLLGP